jgi:translation elongation factor EF-Ts
MRKVNCAECEEEVVICDSDNFIGCEQTVEEHIQQTGHEVVDFFTYEVGRDGYRRVYSE